MKALFCRRILPSQTLTFLAATFYNQRKCSSSVPKRGGEWSCSCGFSNYQFRTQCMKCQLRRAGENSDMAGWTMTSSTERAFKQGDWTCTCGTHNFARRKECMMCRALRPEARRASDTSVKFLSGDWTCASCNSHNFRSREKCFVCGDAHTPVVRDEPTSTWVCSSCHASNQPGADNCCICGVEAAPQQQVESSASTRPSATKSQKQFNDWHCEGCGFTNFASRIKCKQCHAEKKGTSDSSGQSTIDTGSNWPCSCGYLNYKDRSSCRECGQLRDKTPSPGNENES